MMKIPYSRKYWREVNLAVEPKTAIARILADLNLAAQYGIAIHYMQVGILADFNLAVVIKTAKPPNLIPRQIFQLYGSCFIKLESKLLLYSWSYQCH